MSDNNLGIVIKILVSLMIIVVADISTPLGFSVGSCISSRCS